jgi:hypothetical protein
MGMTLWIHTLQDRDMSHESDDHSLMHDLADEVDVICERLGVAKLSGFFDSTDLQYNQGDGEPEGEDLDDEPEDEAEPVIDPETGYAYGIDEMQWFDAVAGLATLEALRDEIEAASASGEPEFGEEEQDLLLDEIDDCIARLREPAANGGRFHLALVM